MEGPAALGLPFGDRFDEPLIEWRRLFAEFLGMAMLFLEDPGNSGAP